MSKIDDQKSAPVLKPRKFSLGRWLRNNFVAGIVVVAPIAITVTLLWWFVTFVDSKIKPVIQPVVQNIFGPLFPERVDVFEYVLLAIPGIGVLIAVVALIFLAVWLQRFWDALYGLPASALLIKFLMSVPFMAQ